MKNVRFFAGLGAVLLIALMALPAHAQTSTWEFDAAHSSASFSVRHFGVSNVKGMFPKLTGTLIWNEADITKSSVEATIDVNSIDTQNQQRDDHLRSPDFFEVAKYPTMTFKSTKVEKVGEGRLRVTGDLTIKGVTKSVVLDVEGPAPPVKNRNTFKSGISATTVINRKDFGLTWNRVLEAGGVAVGDEVKVALEIELNKKP